VLGCAISAAMASKVAPETDSTQAVALSSAKALAADDAGNEGANARSSSKSLHANTNKSSIWWTLDSLSMSAVQISEPVGSSLQHAGRQSTQPTAFRDLGGSCIQLLFFLLV